ncbi:MAG: DegT/DnrJ/EryC1/StrS family aminotransferase [Acidobacteria bacterium]|nr:DegT/DnrJ/EryC1/StrS family aminotransferase [Acidobacteriota bacterium]
MTSKLAILGGPPVRNVTEKPWPTWPPESEAALPYLTDTLRSHRWSIRGWYTGQESVQTRFAKLFAEFNDAKHCVMVSSGSTSLLVALEACDIGVGDEVILPVYTWIATAIAITNVNAIPVFVDVDPATGCIDPETVEASITPRTRAIVPVHLHCAAADMDAVMRLATKYNLYVIEDCAQAHGARFNNRSLGTFGHFGAFSMNQEKLLCCGEGGAILANDDELYDRAFRLRADGSRIGSTAPILGRYELVDTGGLMGGNYCMSDFQAAVLMGELPHLEERNRRREHNAEYLNEKLTRLDGLTAIQSAPGTTSRSYFKYPIRRDPLAFENVPTAALCKALTAELGFTVEQTECQPLHQNPLYCPLSKRRHHLSEEYSERLCVTGMNFPNAEAHYADTLVFHHRILLGNKDDMDCIVEAFEKVQRNAGQLIADAGEK